MATKGIVMSKPWTVQAVFIRQRSVTTTEEHTVVQILIFMAYGGLIAKTSNRGEYSFLEKMKRPN